VFIIKNRILEEAEYILKNNATIRDTAKHFSIGKSTVHKDMKEKLAKISLDLYEKVCLVMNEHLKIRHINGGKVTQEKYQMMRM